ncbi:MAG TPA: hypothetical protein VFL85_01865 [Candidatus Saccharimonadales bacterium]|nr:hypothetical protein [Candidatus Saccharimonadales bacterium]
MNGQTFEVGTDVHEVVPRPNAEELQDIVFVAFGEAKNLPQTERLEVGRYMAQLAKNLLEKD